MALADPANIDLGVEELQQQLDAASVGAAPWAMFGIGSTIRPGPATQSLASWSLPTSTSRPQLICRNLRKRANVWPPDQLRSSSAFGSSAFGTGEHPHDR